MTTINPHNKYMTKIQTSLEYLSDLCLEEEGYKEYSDRDLFNAVVIYQHIFLAKMFDHHKGKVSQRQIEQLALKAGRSLRQTILLFCGKDMHEVVKKL